MLKLFKGYKEKKAFKEFITDKVDRVVDSYKVRVLTSEKRLLIINNNFDNEPYKVEVTTIDNNLANNKVYTFKSNTPYSNENDLQQIEDTINDLWDKRAEEKQAKEENKIKEIDELNKI